jgi:sugar phosphate isomerase/epimerase
MLPNQLEMVLERLASLDYDGVEPYRGLDQVQTMQSIRQHGLKVPSVHLSPPVDESETETLHAAQTYGLDKIREHCETLNRAAEDAQRHGYSLGYHNHWWEFLPFAGEGPQHGRIIHEIMREHLGPAVFFQIDTYFVRMVDLDPAQIVSELKDRIPTLHIKDGGGVRGEPNTAIGGGIMDFAAIHDAHPTVDWWIFEIERAEQPMLEAAAASLDYIKTLLSGM